MSERKPKRAVLYLTWGASQGRRVFDAVHESALVPYDIYWITDHVPNEGVPAGIAVIPADYGGARGNLAKAQVGRFVPPGYDSYLLLDSDTRVLGDIELGFELAERTGLAMVPAKAYDLEHYNVAAADLMRREGIEPCGQLIYNAGVVFFSSDPAVRDLLDAWREMAGRLPVDSDQLALGLVLEKSGLNPAALSINFNYRGFGEYLLGSVRIWHSRGPVPPDLNRYPHESRRVVRGRVRSWSGMKVIRWPHGWRSRRRGPRS